MHEQNKNINFTSTITDNPFDLQPKKIDLILKPRTIKPDIKIDDSKFINFLKKKEKKIQTVERKSVYKKILILSETNLQIEEKIYYKFPFSPQIKKENNFYFQEIYNHFIKAFDSVIFNYKNKKEYFYILINKEIFYFGDKIRVSKGLKEILKVNDIKFIERENELVIEKNELIFVVDFIMNLPFDDNFVIPFILSKHQFENSIFYHSKVIRMPMVHCKNVVKYSYELEGYFFGDDYKELFNYEVKVYD